MRTIFAKILPALLAFSILTGCGTIDTGDIMPPDGPAPEASWTYIGPGEEAPLLTATASNPGGFEWNGYYIVEWDGETPVLELNGNTPLFDGTEVPAPCEEYSDLDDLGRCGPAYAVVCREIQPTEARGEIGSVRPSGWHTVRYNDLISGNYLYNRCHLIGYQLAGENANPRNLITGTRYLNIDGMLPYENAVDDHLEEHDHHVLYRVTPVFVGDELVARGVAMEARCCDCGGIGFFAFAYNAQPGIWIDYATGESARVDGRDQNEIEEEMSEGAPRDFVLNTKSGKFHLPGCSSAAKIADGNRLEMREPLSKMLQAGYEPCGQCLPDAE